MTRKKRCGFEKGKGGFKPKENSLRRKHYKLLRKAGFSVDTCIQLRDWKIQKIKLYIETHKNGI